MPMFCYCCFCLFELTRLSQSQFTKLIFCQIKIYYECSSPNLLYCIVLKQKQLKNTWAELISPPLRRLDFDTISVRIDHAISNTTWATHQIFISQ